MAKATTPPEKASAHYSLSGLMVMVESAINQTFKGESYWIKAEISNFSISPKGYGRLELIEKDPQSSENLASIKGYIWKLSMDRIQNNFIRETGIELQKDIKILFRAKVIFNKNYGISISIEDIDPSYTLGESERAKREIINKIKEEGVFDNNRKLPFPMVVQKIAIISARDSKGYEDFMSVLHTNPYGYRYETSLYEAKLAGSTAALEMKNKLIEIFKSNIPYDCVVIVRGGGGFMECFNDYILTRAVARFPMPVLAGIGHTANNSIVDLVCHKDFITPTEVAKYFVEQNRLFELNLLDIKQQIRFYTLELIESNREELLAISKDMLNLGINPLLQAQHQISLLKRDFVHESKKLLSVAKNGLSLERKMISSLTKQVIKERKQKLTEINNKFRINTLSILKENTHLLAVSSVKIDLLHPKNLLKRGYSFVINQLNGKSVHTIKQVQVGDEVTIHISDGTLQANIQKINKT